MRLIDVCIFGVCAWCDCFPGDMLDWCACCVVVGGGVVCLIGVRVSLVGGSEWYC